MKRSSRVRGYDRRKMPHPLSLIIIVAALLVSACSKTEPLPDVAKPTVGVAIPTPSVKMSDANTLVWQGGIDEERYAEFKRLLPTLPDSGVVLFRNSPGGKIVVATNTFLAINRRNLRVEIEGLCASACADVFLFSKRRGLSPKADLGITYLFLHGTFNERTQQRVSDPAFNETRAEMLLQNTGQRFRKDLFLRSLNTQSRDGGLMIFMQGQPYAGGIAHVLFCDRSGWFKRFGCEVIPDETPTTLGILDLPPR
jgi:hypothetical protein